MIFKANKYLGKTLKLVKYMIRKLLWLPYMLRTCKELDIGVTSNGKTCLYFLKRDKKNNIESVWADSIRNLFSPFANNADVIIDCGANIGAYSIPFVHENPDLTAFIFEADPRLNQCLRKSIAENKILDRCTLFEKGVSYAAGKGEFFINLQTSGESSFRKNAFFDRQGGLAKKVLVPITSLDAELHGGIIDFNKKIAMKIDVQGLDWDVLFFGGG